MFMNMFMARFSVTHLRRFHFLWNFQTMPGKKHHKTKFWIVKNQKDRRWHLQRCHWCQWSSRHWGAAKFGVSSHCPGTLRQAVVAGERTHCFTLPLVEVNSGAMAGHVHASWKHFVLILFPRHNVRHMCFAASWSCDTDQTSREVVHVGIIENIVIVLSWAGHFQIVCKYTYSTVTLLHNAVI